MMNRSMLAYIPVNISNIIVSFGLITVLTRLLSSSEFGMYGIAVITLQFMHMGLFTWLEAAMVRFLARAEKDDDVNSHLKTLYTYALWSFLIIWVGILAIIFILPISNGMKNLFGFALTSGCLSIFFNLGMEAHKAAHRIKRYSLSYTLVKLLGFAIGIALILLTPLRESAPFIGVIIAMVCILIFDLPFMMKQMKGGKVEHSKIKTYFSYGMPISLSLLLTYTLSSGDMYIIKALMGDSAVGIYNAGYNLSNRSLDVLFVWIAMAVTPIAITTLEQSGVEDSKRILHGYGVTLLWYILPAATGIALVAEPAGFVLGESVREGAVQIIPWIAFSGVLNGLITYYAHRAFMLSQKTQMFVWAMVPPAALNIGLNFWLIPLYGLMGAVYATIAAYGFGLIIAILMGRRYYPLPLPFKEFFQISLACLGMAACVMITPLPTDLPDFIELLIKAIIGVMAYGGICYVTNAANSRNIMLDIIQKFRPKSTSIDAA